MAIFPGSAIPSAVSDYEIDNSLRFDDGDTPYMSWTPSAANSVRTRWTISAWVKLGNFGGNRDIFSAGDGAAKEFSLSINSANNLSVYNYTSGVYNLVATTSAVLRDPSAWYHILCRYDSTDVTSDDRVQLFINGERQTLGTNTQPSSSFAADFWSYNGAHFISSYPLSRTNYMDGYLAEVYSIDGTAYTASDFGELSSTTNQWKPIDASGLTFGTNGFYQKYGATELANSFTDSADHTVHAVTANGSAHTDTSVKKIGTASAEFVRATSDYLSVPDSSDWDFGTGDFTLECWIRPSSVEGRWINSFASSSSRFYFGDTSAGNVTFVAYNGSRIASYTSSGTEVSGLDTWYHVAAVRNGTNFYIFVDGVSLSLTVANAIGTSAMPNVASTLDISKADTTYYDGYMDEIRISHTARYTSNFPPSTTAFTADKYTKLLLHCDGSDSGTTFTDSSDGPRHIITAVGDAANSRAQKKVGDSSIFFDGTGDYLTTTLGDTSDWAFGTENWTIEFWVRFSGGLGAAQRVVNFAELTTPPIGGMIETGADNKMVYYEYTLNSDWTKWCYDTNAYVLDTWYHYAVVRQGSDFRMYRDGVEQESDGTSSASLASAHGPYIGTNRGVAGWLTGYMDEIRISDSARYPDGTTFTPQTTAFTADANTKLLIHSNWTGGLGADSSGNYNTFTPTNLVATDQMIDTPTNNFCTWNPLWGRTGKMPVLTEGNLIGASSDAAQTPISATFAGIQSGKWYWEIEIKAKGGSDCKIGLLNSSGKMTDVNQSNHYYRLYLADTGNKFTDTDASTISYGNTYAAGDIVGIALDMTNGALYFSKNNTWQTSGDPTSGASKTGAAFTDVLSAMPDGGKSGGTGWVPYVDASDTTVRYVLNAGQDSSFAGEKTAQGNQDSNEKGDFYYTPPTDYLALCTDNLSDPEIALPGENFNTVLYTGNGSTQSITGAGFQPDVIWIKNREITENHFIASSLQDADGNKYLYVNLTSIEGDRADGVTSIDADGFSLGAWGNNNTVSDAHVSWLWKAGGAPTADNSAGAGATPTAGSVKIDGSNLGSALAGSIAATRISANTTAGFSIVKYVGTGATATIAHGLGVTPELVIVKSMDSAEAWNVYAEPVSADPATDYLTLNTTAAVADDDRFWNDTAPSASVFTVGSYDGTNKSTDDLIAYCFHSVDGYSKVGSYEGNLTSGGDGTFIYLGFKPALFMVKNITSSYFDTQASDWLLWDNKRGPSLTGPPNYNANTENLWANQNSSEASAQGHDIDFLSNGVKMRSSGGSMNETTQSYIYYGVASHPFKTSNAR